MSDTAGYRRDGSVDELLLEADLDGDAQLRPVLLELRALATVTPAPSAELLALMTHTNGPLGVKTAAVSSVELTGEATAAPAVKVPAAAADELAARRRAKRRIALTTLSVAVSLGAGGAVAAASDQSIRDSFNQLNQAVASFITGSGAADGGRKQPAAPLPPAPAGTVPATAPGSPASVPADPAGAPQPAVIPPSNGSVAPESTMGQQTSPGKPGEVPASGTLPGVIPEHIANGPGTSPEVPVPPQLPLPGTLPPVPLP